LSCKISVPFKNPDDIKKAAERFLHKYHPEDIYPIPIEEIIEFQLRLNIIPIDGLHNIIDTDGFVSSDLTSISVEEYIYKNRPGRYRFTLAHEIGHLVLHEHIYEQCEFDTMGEWKKFIKNFPEKEYSWLEWQANEFAGLVLVPSHHLKKRLSYHTKQLKALSIKDEYVILDRVVELLSKDFVVSRDVIRRRLHREFDKQNQ
jgi:Zn-dependent peptidase ImmA (M78 family)